MAGLTPARTLEGAALHVASDGQAVSKLAAHYIAAQATAAIRDRGTFRVALAGGRTPARAYELLAAKTSGIDWSRVEVFFGDERRVPPSDASSNFRMASEALLDRVSIPEAAVHRIHGEADVATAVADYTEALGDAPLDLVLLGMGDDGHVASLFPGGPELASRLRVVASVAPVAPHERISLGFSVIHAARSVGLLVSGGGKADRVREIFDEMRSGAPRLPAARVMPASGALHWFLDEAAAAKL